MRGVGRRVQVLPRRARGANAVVRRVGTSVRLERADGTAECWIPLPALCSVAQRLVPSKRTVCALAILLRRGSLHTVPARCARRGEAGARTLPRGVLVLASGALRAPALVRLVLVEPLGAVGALAPQSARGSHALPASSSTCRWLIEAGGLPRLVLVLGSSRASRALLRPLVVGTGPASRARGAR